jgi:hypothetical protein
MFPNLSLTKDFNLKLYKSIKLIQTEKKDIIRTQNWRIYMKKSSFGFCLILGTSAFLNMASANDSTFANSQPNIQLTSAQFNEQQFLAERCRLIKNQAYSTGGGGFGSGQIHLAIHNIENFLYSVNTPLAFQMLGELQKAGYNGFNAWCSKYGI